MWNEQDHPRDDDGKFTFKNGETSSNTKERAADILYKDEKIKREKDKQESEYKSKLLNILSNKAKPTDVLYGTTKELEEKVKEYGLEDKLNKAWINVKNGTKKTINKVLNTEPAQKVIRNNIGENYKKGVNWMTQHTMGKDTSGMLDLSHGINMNDRNYIKDTISLDNYNDPKVASDKEYLKDKISKQFKDYNFDINKIKGYFFKSNSESVQRLIENKDFQDMIRSHKDEIIKKGEFSGGFKKHGLIGLGIENNFHNAIGKADFRNIYQDKEGNLHIKMYDTYDFNKDEDNAFVRAGADQMEKGNLKPYFSIYDIIIPKGKLDEIWK